MEGRKGHQIQACVRNELIPDFEDLIKEDGVYVLRKFGMGVQGDLYPFVGLKKKINFYRCTSVTPVEAFSGDPYGFYFWKFDDINKGKAAEVKTVDVVGRLAWCGDLDIWTTKAKETKRLIFDLQDLEGIVLKCTFWGDFADEFHKYVSSNTQTNEMVIVILQHVRVKLWNEMLGVQNDKYRKPNKSHPPNAQHKQHVCCP
uniref:uncharacterized protein LOC122608961 n=1 Tax=Erigeron canadensis TaxID=72917 RepID=UPI001CB94CB9|nr:uncharacterized protein LOC122608961 [Erigeron canadensis]